MQETETSSRTQRNALWGVSIGHAAHDAWYGVAPVLLASLSAELDLSNSEIGLMLLLYQLFSSVSQPYFGRLSERVSSRLLAVSAIVWTTLMFTVTLFVGSKLLLAIFIALAGFGSGTWHPQGAANATLSGGSRWAATAASIFFLGGTMGSAFIGAGLGGFMLSRFGRPSLVVVSVITLTLGLTLVRRLVPGKPVSTPRKATERSTGDSSARNALGVVLIILLLAIALRSLAFHSMTTYIPKYQEDMGASPDAYGFLMLLFLSTGAIGGVLGSYLADRVGLGLVLVATILLSAVAFYGFLATQGVWSYLTFALTGLFIGPSHTLFIVAGQRRYPQRMAMISGLFMGFTFVSGAGGAWVLGWLGDMYGLARVLGALPWIAAGAAVFALLSVPLRRAKGAATAASSEAA